MKKTLFLLLVYFLCQASTFGQKSEKEKIKTFRISYPEHYIENLQKISVSINVGSVFSEEAIETLGSINTSSRKMLWASTESAGSLPAYYFSFPGYTYSNDNDALKVQITFDKLTVTGKKLKEIQEEYVENNEKKLRPAFVFDLTYTFPASLEVSYQGNVLLKEELKEQASGTASFGSDQYGSFPDKEQLEKEYKKMEGVVSRVIERNAIISALMEARKKVETAFLFSYTGLDLAIYGAKGKGFDYSELDKAQEITLKAFEAYNQDKDLVKLQGALAPAAEIWLKEVENTNIEDKKARITDKIGQGLCNNLAIVELIKNDPGKTAEWINRAESYGRLNLDLKDVSDWMEICKKQDIAGLDIMALGDRIIPADISVKSENHPGMARIDMLISKSRDVKKVVGYESLLAVEEAPKKPEPQAEKPAEKPAPVQAAAETAIPVQPVAAIGGKAISSFKEIDPVRMRNWEYSDGRIIGLGDKSIGISGDGGKTWMIQQLPVDKARIACFPTADVGYVTTVKKGIFKTTDGGMTWKEISQPSAEFFPQSIAFVDENTGFISDGMNYFYTTRDGGQTWTKFESIHLGNVAGFVIIDKQNIGVISYLRMFFTADGGQTWNPAPSKGQEFKSPVSGYFFNTTEGVLVCEQFRVLQTTDAAKTFKAAFELSSDTGVTLSDVDFSMKTAGLGVAISLNGMLITKDGGNSWSTLSPTVKAARRIFFDGQGNFYIGSETGLWMSSDGGASIVQILK